MRTLALLMALASSTAAAAERHHGWLTGAGLMIAGGGAVAASLGAYDAAQAEAAAFALKAYYVNGAAPTADEAATVRWLHERAEAKGATGVALLLGGGAALVVGICLVLLDGWLGPAHVSISVEPGGASMRVRGTF